MCLCLSASVCLCLCLSLSASCSVSTCVPVVCLSTRAHLLSSFSVSASVFSSVYFEAVAEPWLLVNLTFGSEDVRVMGCTYLVSTRLPGDSCRTVIQFHTCRWFLWVVCVRCGVRRCYFPLLLTQGRTRASHLSPPLSAYFPFCLSPCLSAEREGGGGGGGRRREKERGGRKERE